MTPQNPETAEAIETYLKAIRAKLAKGPILQDV